MELQEGVSRQSYSFGLGSEERAGGDMRTSEKTESEKPAAPTFFTKSSGLGTPLIWGAPGSRAKHQRQFQKSFTRAAGDQGLHTCIPPKPLNSPASTPKGRAGPSGTARQHDPRPELPPGQAEVGAARGRSSPRHAEAQLGRAT